LKTTRPLTGHGSPKSTSTPTAGGKALNERRHSGNYSGRPDP
jgi:hypothetical protein